MIKILHIYPKNNADTAEFVSLLVSSISSDDAVVVSTSSLSEVRKQLKHDRPDILHLHGCWWTGASRVVSQAIHLGVRIVISPHGELEPWIIHDRFVTEKLPKLALYQRNIVKRAYTVIVMGSMEQQCMQKLKWNPRVEIIRNPLITKSITPEEAAAQHMDIYRKVMSSDVYALMDERTRHTFSSIMKVGIADDARWITTLDKPADLHTWRQLLLMAQHEGVIDTFLHGMSLLYLEAPDIFPEEIPYYLPTHFQQPPSIESVIGNSFVNENERLMATFRFLHKQYRKGKLSLSQLIELDGEIRAHESNEEELQEQLSIDHLDKFAARMMAVLSRVTMLEEGYHPLPLLNDRSARRIETMIFTQHKI